MNDIEGRKILSELVCKNKQKFVSRNSELRIRKGDQRYSCNYILRHDERERELLFFIFEIF